MKVLQILPSLEVGGVERGVIDLARAMQQRGEECFVISSGGELVGELQKMGITHYTLPVHKKSLLSLKLVPKITEIIRRENIDLVHARSRVPAWLAWLASRSTGVPFVTTCHGYYSNHPLSQIMGWGKRVIVISNIIGRRMMDDFRVPAERIRLIHRGVDLSQFSFHPKSPKSPEDPFVIVNIGRLSPIKGQLEFLESIYSLRQKMKNIEVWLIGSEGKGKTKYTALLKKMTGTLGLQKVVKFLGTRRDIPELLAKADLLVLSTLVPEAFGRVLVEAGAVGTPVLATRVGGILDIIEDGKNGLLVEPKDIEGMAQAMHSLLTDRVRSGALARSLFQKVHESFSLDRMITETLRIYQEVKDEKKILVIKLGSMGDVILATPSLRMIRNRFPKAHIAMLVDKKWTPLLSNCPYVDEIIPVQRGRLSRILYLLKIAKRLRSMAFDCSVDLQNSKWTHLAACVAGIPERYGYARGQLGFLLNRSDENYNVQAPPVEHQFRILAKLGVREMERHLEVWPEPYVFEKNSELSFLDSQKKYIGLVVGSSPQWPSKRWPLLFYGELAQKLTEDLGYEVALIGSTEDRALAEEVFDGAAGIHNLIGRTSLRDLVGVIEKMELIVTGDTAPLHIAAAVNTKIVALFGPTDPKRHMPPASSAVVLTRSLPCQPCYQGTCKIADTLACLKNISVEEVFGTVKKQLQESHLVSNCKKK